MVMQQISRLEPLIAAPTTRRDCQIRSDISKSNTLRCPWCCYLQPSPTRPTCATEKDESPLHILCPFDEVSAVMHRLSGLEPLVAPPRVRRSSQMNSNLS